jgi:hypothetical protein
LEKKKFRFEKKETKPKGEKIKILRKSTEPRKEKVKIKKFFTFSKAGIIKKK